MEQDEPAEPVEHDQHPSSKEMAHLTNLHYLYDKYSKDPKMMESKVISQMPKGYRINYDLSNSGVLVVDKKKDRYISVKGTDPYNPKDLASDFMLSLGLQKSNPQFQERKNHIKGIMRNDPTKNYYLTSHSLGSSIVLQSMVSSPSIRNITKKAYLFNQGSTPVFEATLRPSREVEDILNKKIESHKHANDFISKSAGSYGTTYIHRNKKTGLEAHSISNFL
jgi:hypothetical protein